MMFSACRGCVEVQPHRRSRSIHTSLSKPVSAGACSVSLARPLPSAGHVCSPSYLIGSLLRPIPS